jgi:hypothetical protein
VSVESGRAELGIAVAIRNPARYSFQGIRSTDGDSVIDCDVQPHCQVRYRRTRPAHDGAFVSRSEYLGRG